MREKLRSQRETVIALPKPWDSRQNRLTILAMKTHYSLCISCEYKLIVTRCQCKHYGIVW